MEIINEPASYPPINTIYRNSSIPSLNLVYPSDWEIVVKEFSDIDEKDFKSQYFGGSNCSSNCMGIKLTKNDISLIIIFNLAHDLGPYSCSNTVEYLPIANNWIRIQDSVGYSYSKSYEFDYTTGQEDYYMFGNRDDEWNRNSYQTYKLCIKRYHTLEKLAVTNNSDSSYGDLVILIEDPVVIGNPNSDILEEIDTIIGNLN